MKINLKATIILFFLLFLKNNLYADANYQRVDKLSKNLRCLICQGQSVYDSNSEFALSIKDLIKKKFRRVKKTKIFMII